MQAIAGFIPLWVIATHALLSCELVCLHYFRDESKVLPIAIPVLLSIPPNTHYAIRSITLRLVAQLSEWIDKHPDTLDQVLKFILDGLQIPPVASDAAKAVHSVCQKCKERMAPHFQGLLQVSESNTLQMCVGFEKRNNYSLVPRPLPAFLAGVPGISSVVY